MPWTLPQPLLRANGKPKAVDKVVAQVSQPAVSQCFQPADAAHANMPSDFGHAADWKSAIQQVGNLRYVFAARRSGVLKDFVNGLDGKPLRAAIALDVTGQPGVNGGRRH